MNFDTVNRHQKAVLWEAAGFDGNGDPKVSSPVELKDLRWETGKREVPGPDGTPISADATVFANRTIPIDSVMWEGKLTALPSPVIDDLFIVVANEISPDVKNRSVNKVAVLQRWKGVLPSIA